MRTRLDPVALVRARASPVAAARLTTAGFAAIVVLLTSAVLTPSGRGELAALQAAALVVSAVGGLSLSLGISLAVGQDANEARTGAALGVALAVLLAAILTPVAAALHSTLGVSAATAVATALIAATIAGYGALQGLPIGLDRLRAYAGADVARGALSLAAVAAALAAGVRSPGALVALWGCGTLAGAAALVALARRNQQPASPWRETARTALRRALRAHPTNVVGLAVARLDIVVLAAVSTRSQVAYYSLAVVFAEAAWLLPSALAVTALSDYVRLPKTDALSAARTALRRTLAASSITGIAAGAAGVVAVFAFLPHAYRASLAPLWIVIAGTVPYSVGHVASPYLVTAVDRPGLSTAIAAATLATDVVLVLVLGGPLGAIGAAVASTVAYALNAALNRAALRRVAGLRPAPR